MRAVSAALALALLAGLVLLLWGGGGEAISRWAAGQQREVQEALAAQLRALRAGSPGALIGFLGVCFAYGFFHAAGPGHGKVVIGGYGVARRITMLRLSAVALAASLGQAVTAILLVGAGALLLRASTAQLTGMAETWFALASALAILLVGLWLVWRGLRRLRLAQGQAPVSELVPVGAGPEPQVPQSLARDFLVAQTEGGAPDPQGSGGPGRAHAHTHGAGEVCETCGHVHAPDPNAVLAARNWRELLAVIGAVAIRPCTGALFVLILGLRLQITAAAIAGTFAMALGTASITIAVAILSTGLRESSLAAAGGWARARHLGSLLEVAAGLLVALLAWGLLRGAL
ncbi:nickel/cobalt transporter [Dinoroseobacter sp. S124A]|uniref:nickel/cobalt transporter n=1 Tax=Dinoroseobacter sp. S124A TaxID=3415128 RepID=UPI003C7D6BC5